MTANQIIARMRADKCLTPSRSRSKRKHHNYSNKYTRLLGERGYKGIRKDGYFTKIYSYGVVGHCCIGVQAHLIRAGYPELVPKSKGYIWNTNNYAAWLRSEPVIHQLGRVNWTTDATTAAMAARSGKLVVTFKGKKGHSKFTHTCVLLGISGGKVRTVDFNISGIYKGKKVNNGLTKSRKKSSYRWAFAILPIPVKAPAYKAGETYTLQSTMNVREDHAKSSKLKSRIKAGEKVKALDTWKSPAGVWWIRTSFGWICAKTNSKTYLI